MKKAKKVLALVLCAVLLVGASIAGTVAYLTDTKSVTNTFTVGNIQIELKEYDVDKQSGLKKDPLAEVERLDELELLPGREIQKHPFVRVLKDSEPCWLFVKVENGLSGFEATGATTIESQLAENGWSLVTGETDVYYYKAIVPTSAENQTFDIFKSIKIADEANDVTGWDAIATNGDVVITAYAIQSETFADQAAAWAAVKPTP